MKIKYEFGSISSTLTSIQNEINNLETLKSNINSLQTDISEISGALAAAKNAIIKNIDSVIDPMKTIIEKSNNAMADLQAYESKAAGSDAINKELNVQEVTPAPSANASINGNISDSGNVPNTNNEQSSQSYTIKEGDTLSEIAKANNITVEELAKANNISNPDMILAGATLIIPTSSNTNGKANPDNSQVNKEVKEETNKQDKVVDSNNGSVINIPDGLGSSHTYMGWQLVTSTTSDQYRLREDAGMNFDSEGLGIINGRYVVATTTTFGQVGDYVDFVQEDGTVLKCVIGDIKNQNDSDCNQWGHNNGNTVVEFVVNEDTWYTNGKGTHANPGTKSFHPEWNRNITHAINHGNYWDS